jgi:multidrug efflux pump subunit AcrA (membrane-fusion protein)
VNKLLIAIVAGLLLAVLAVVAGAQNPEEHANNNGLLTPAANPSSPDEIVFSGKIVCSLVRQAALPFHGVIEDVKVKAGDRVEAGQVLAEYRLTPEALLKLDRDLAPLKLRELEIQLTEAEQTVEELKLRQEEARRLAAQDLTAPRSRERVEWELKLARSRWQRLNSAVEEARRLWKREQKLVAEQLGNVAELGQLPETAAILAPISGHVIWVHPDLRARSEMTPTSPVALVGVMQPMLVRAQVHEMEAQRLQLGDEGLVTVESLASQRFTARVVRKAWSPVTMDPQKPSYYEVEMALDNQELSLKMGMKAQVSIRKQQKPASAPERATPAPGSTEPTTGAVSAPGAKPGEKPAGQAKP